LQESCPVNFPKGKLFLNTSEAHYIIFKSKNKLTVLKIPKVREPLP
jgi:hypothetical protein